MKIVGGKRPASLSVWLVKGRWQTSGALKTKLVCVIVGLTEPRCCLVNLLMGRTPSDRLM
jgi:hypothetical protein